MSEANTQNGKSEVEKCDKCGRGGSPTLCKCTDYGVEGCPSCTMYDLDGKLRCRKNCAFMVEVNDFEVECDFEPADDYGPGSYTCDVYKRHGDFVTSFLAGNRIECRKLADELILRRRYQEGA